ncbi:MAG: methyltransferase [Microbacterium sp.]
MTETDTRRLWVAYGSAGVVGIIRKDEAAFTVTLAGADAPLGAYDTMDAAKGALYSHLTPGSDWPEFREH